MLPKICRACGEEIEPCDPLRTNPNVCAGCADYRGEPGILSIEELAAKLISLFPNLTGDQDLAARQAARPHEDWEVASDSGKEKPSGNRDFGTKGLLKASSKA